MANTFVSFYAIDSILIIAVYFNTDTFSTRSILLSAWLWKKPQTNTTDFENNCQWSKMQCLGIRSRIDKRTFQPPAFPIYLMNKNISV